jgi:rhodanese-related sulfurtransferase
MPSVRLRYGRPMSDEHGSGPPEGARSGIERHLDRVRSSLERVTAEQAYAELRMGALLVDTRTFEQRRVQGDVPGAVCIDRTVLEWRLDPTNPWSIPEVADADTRIIVMCRQGFSSSLAASSLQAIGLGRATDIIGGFEAWRDAALPVSPFEDPGDPA